MGLIKATLLSPTAAAAGAGSAWALKHRPPRVRCIIHAVDACLSRAAVRHGVTGLCSPVRLRSVPSALAPLRRRPGVLCYIPSPESGCVTQRPVYPLGVSPPVSPLIHRLSRVSRRAWRGLSGDALVARDAWSALVKRLRVKQTAARLGFGLSRDLSV